MATSKSITISFVCIFTYDEINLVEPGINSGWNKIDGIWLRGYPIEDTEDRVATNQTKGLLVDFNGKGKYSPPEFT